MQGAVSGDFITDMEHARLYAKYRPDYSLTNIVPVIKDYIHSGGKQVSVITVVIDCSHWKLMCTSVFHYCIFELKIGIVRKHIDAFLLK